jgi:hypothetical protein
MAQRLSFKGMVLARSIKATFERRNTILPETFPFAFTASFMNDITKIKQWNAFLLKNQPWIEKMKLSDVIEMLKIFLMPPLLSLVQDNEFNFIWKTGGPWKKCNDEIVIKN